MWTNAMQRQRLEQHERSKNDSFKWDTKVLSFFFEKIQKKKLLHLSLSRLCDVVVEVFIIKSRTQNASNSSRCSRYMVVVFVPQSFCDVVVIVFVVVVQNDCKELFTERQQTTTTKASICVLSQSMWHLYKRMYLLFSSQHLHITRLRLVI